MLRFRTRALAVDFGPRVGEVAQHELDATARRIDDAAFSAILETLQDLVFDDDVPRVVELGRLQHRARRGHRIAATLHLD